jgi:pilus assembly protein Flp/PilA
MFLFDAEASGRSARSDVMKSFATKLRRFLVSEDGPTAVEYAVMLALIIAVCLAAITTIGTNANSIFSKVAGSL